MVTNKRSMLRIKKKGGNQFSNFSVFQTNVGSCKESEYRKIWIRIEYLTWNTGKCQRHKNLNFNKHSVWEIHDFTIRLPYLLNLKAVVNIYSFYQINKILPTTSQSWASAKLLLWGMPQSLQFSFDSQYVFPFNMYLSRWSMSRVEQIWMILSRFCHDGSSSEPYYRSTHLCCNEIWRIQFGR